jgi:hypothetical protein
MLKPLTKSHIAKYGAIENGILQTQNMTTAITPPDLVKYCKRSFRGIFLYTFDNDYFDFFTNNRIEYKNITIKTIYGGTAIMAVKIISGQNILTLVNAAFMFPVKPDNLYNALFYLYNKLGKGILPSYTPATFALRLWRFKFQKETLRGINSRIDDFVRTAYAGGRSEIISKKLDKGYYYDINSMYGAMMLKDMPTGRVIYTETRTKDLIGFYQCEIDQRNINLPPLWQKIHNDNKSKDMLCFPADKFTGIFSGNEIDMAIEAGAEIKILNGIEWESKSPVFKEFIEYIYKLKEQTKYKWFDAFLKKVMVSFYGKFAENKDKYQDIFQCGDVKNYYKEIDNGAKLIDEHNLTIAKNKEKKVKYNKNSYNLPHFSAYISALGREEIYKTAIKLKSVAYIETDAIFTAQILPIGNGLGEWKLVGEVQNAEFVQSKTYSYEMDNQRHYVAAGIPETVNKAAYFKGESVKFYKKQKFVSEKREYNVKMKDTQFIKRDIKDNFSMPLSVSEILQRMQLNNAFSP